MSTAYNFENISELCRICLTESKEMTNIDEINKVVTDLFDNFIKFKLSVDGVFLNKLCVPCKEKLEIAYDIIELAKRSQEILEGYVQFKSVNDDVVVEGDSCDFEEEISPIVKETKKQNVEFTYDDIMREIRNIENICDSDINCIKCDFVGINVKALISHMAIVHKESKNKWCSLCNEFQEDLNGHKARHRNCGLRCKFCGSNFSIQNNLVQHLLNHTKKFRYNCTTCNKNFASQQSLDKHEILHYSEGNYYCSTCGKSFVYKVWHERHEKVCGKAKSEVGLVDILLKNEDIRTCNKDENFAQKEVKKSGKRDSKLCTVCGKQFSSSSRLQAHMETHSDVGRYACRFCGKSCATRTHLVTHERVHTGERPYICNVCDKSFNQSSILKTHQKTHVEKTIACGMCDKKFTRHCELKVHLRTHTGEKPFQCQVCEKAFIQRSHLLDHEKTHLHVKPYKCLYCERAFAQKSTLKTHIAIHLGVKSYKCDICPYSARQSYVLKMHMKQHENDTENCDDF